MFGVEIAAHAKINLSLDVLGKREDGYHNLRTIMQTIALHDTIRLDKAATGISLGCKGKKIPSGKTNIAWKAARLMIDHLGLKSGVKIRIVKRIPISAGLAGGSADAAAVLKGMNVLFGCGLSTSELEGLGVQLGADIPFCISGGTKLAEGIGERLKELHDFSGVDIVLIKPGRGVSTSRVFENLDISKIRAEDRPDVDIIVNAIGCRDIKATAEHMKNVLETVTIPKYPIVQEAKDKLMNNGALGSMMSGSGTTVFGIFQDSDTAVKAYEALCRDKRWLCFYTKTEKGREAGGNKDPAPAVNKGLQG